MILFVCGGTPASSAERMVGRDGGREWKERSKERKGSKEWRKRGIVEKRESGEGEGKRNHRKEE